MLQNHFSPESDSFFESSLSIQYLNWTEKNFFSIDTNEVSSTFSKFDVIIGEGLAPAVLSKSKVKMNIFTPFGGDLYGVPFYKRKNTLRAI